MAHLIASVELREIIYLSADIKQRYREKNGKAGREEKATINRLLVLLPCAVYVRGNHNYVYFGWDRSRSLARPSPASDRPFICYRRISAGGNLADRISFISLYVYPGDEGMPRRSVRL